MLGSRFPAPALNISAKYIDPGAAPSLNSSGKLVQISILDGKANSRFRDVANATYSTRSNNQTFVLGDSSTQGRCQPDITYMWGFSFLLLFNFPHIGATINFFNSDKSSAHGFTPSVSTTFSANGAVNVTASVGVPIGVAIGIDVLDGEWTEEVALVDRPALEAVAMWAGASCDDDDEVCQATKDSQSTCSGIDWYVDLVNELTFDLFGSKYGIGNWDGPTLAAGCLGTEPVATSSSSTTTFTTAAPTPTSDNLITNGGFDQVNTDGTPAGYQFFTWDQNLAPTTGTNFYSTYDGAALSSPNSL